MPRPVAPVQPMWPAEPPQMQPAQLGRPIEGGSSPVTPAVYESPLAASSKPVDAAAPPPLPLVTAQPLAMADTRVTNAAGGDAFGQLRQRLRAVGTTRFALESWGNSGELFRVVCEVPLSADPNFARSFQATAAEPLEAMAQVLREIEAWRASRAAGNP
jgi:hypothetical protein